MKIKLFLALSVLAMSMQSHTINLSDLSQADQDYLIKKSQQVYNELVNQKLAPGMLDYNTSMPAVQDCWNVRNKELMSKHKSSIHGRHVSEIRAQMVFDALNNQRSTFVTCGQGLLHKQKDLALIPAKQASVDFGQAIKALQGQNNADANLRKGAMNFLQTQDRLRARADVAFEQKMHQAAVSSFENEGGVRFIQNIKPNNTAQFDRNMSHILKSAPSMISANAKLNAMKCGLAFTALSAIVATAPSKVESTSMLESDSQLEAVGAQGQIHPLTSEEVNFLYAQTAAHKRLNQSRFESALQSAQARPYVAITIAAAGAAGLGFCAYKLAKKLAKNYFGKAVVKTDVVKAEKPNVAVEKFARKRSQSAGKKRAKRVVRRRSN